MKNRKLSLKLIIAILLCVTMLMVEWGKPRFLIDERRNGWAVDCLKLSLGVMAMLCILSYFQIKVFSKPKGLFYLIPALIIAVDNFPFWSFFSGNMRFIYSTPKDVLLFAFSCVLTGFFEEFIFRGLLFTALTEVFSSDKKGFLKSYVYSSLIFGLSHLLNLAGGNVGATLLQAGYSILTGGLFCFLFIKTRNIVAPALIHGAYNFCGLLLSEQGLGTGVVFDVGTIVIMAIISILVGIFVIYSLYKYTEEERRSLYATLTKNE